MNLVDVHCHLNHKEFEGKLDEVLKNAEKAGVKAIVVSGVNTASNREVLALSKKYPIIKASLGIYPIDALGLADGETGLARQIGKIDLDEEFTFMEEHQDEFVSIGEIGMDFNWADKEKTLEQQSETFRKIIRFAKKIKKPIVIHSRKAELQCLDILEEELPNNEIPVDLHCFSGRKHLTKRAAALGYYFSIPPNIVKAQNFQIAVELVPLTQLLTETDAPWLSPFRDKINEPAYVTETIKKIAEIKGLSVEEVADQIWKNYVKVFG
ncbi:TatD family hydrolase [Candidatus Woesearchaeota archaeon]|nr:TatD family hydrolase [Candidatus Woesearchaeota archaeon]MBT4151287.1 TatD family hydrolase [Candidatus Woesearchaeota archaeon]MBT4247476.1 TatD family hydrolase [Candidatus Woesearchaeota archaeon]MBT4434109.1 TatD family hydrolase [Candidatus Woesearchaeota archaeon]MBT7332232.1 TatD family hydrolase [Candidatus Woesearchaeota archaeon]